MLPESQYVEVREGGYYIAGTRIGLDVIYHEFRNGETADDILRSYSSLGSLKKVYGAILFILEHPAEVDAYLKAQDRIFEEFKAQHPMPEHMLGAFNTARNEEPIQVA